MRKLVLSLSLTLLIASPALALRCGTDLVDVGDDTMTLIARCGQPAQREQLSERHVDAAGNVFFKTYEVWTYNFGPQQFLARVEIRGGRIRSITNSGRGF